MSVLQHAHSQSFAIASIEHLTPSVPLSALRLLPCLVVPLAERGKIMLLWFPRVDEVASCDLVYPGLSVWRSSGALLENAGSCPRLFP